ncbi:MAG: 4-aminobutyrate--2-oxoglutarate transaminase [Chloroflexota bacterium]
MQTLSDVSVESKSARIWEERERWVPRGVSTYSHVVVDHAHGVYVWDVDGKRYLDFAGGIGTLNVGHTPEPVVEAIRDQSEKLIHMCFSVAIYEPYVELARRLALSTPGSFAKKTILVNSGAEAIENAIKIARSATDRQTVIAFQHSFHGRTMMAMTLTGRSTPYKVGFGPFAPDVYHASYPYSYRCPYDTCRHNGGSDDCPIESGQELERMLEDRLDGDQVAAVIVEPVLGEGGFVVAPTRFLQNIRKLCDRHGIIMIADEVQTGFGRTGRMFAIENSGVEPDLVVVAKSIAAGLPLAAVIGKAEIMDAPMVGGIGGTYGGNPVACRAGLAVLDQFDQLDLVAAARDIGRRIQARFEEMQRRYPIIGDVRGLGAMMAMELVRDRQSKEPAKEDTAAIMHRCHDNGLIIIKAGVHDNVIRVLVPLIIEPKELDAGLDILEEALSSVA